MRLRSALPVAVLFGGIFGLSLAASSAGERSGSLLSSLFHPSSPHQIVLLDPAPENDTPVSWDIPVVRNEPVRRYVRLFHERQPDRMALYLKRSGRYEGMIRTKLREQGMPEDLLYLSMIESGFNPTARSPARAVGLWQFVASTGLSYGLRIDSYVDERRHPEKSTDAALRYLRHLHDRFGSWSLAAAAYNGGENRVGRIMREETGAERGDEADFWRIRARLPRETRNYVPLIFAAALVGKEPHKYGMDGVERWLPLPTESVLVPGGTSLKAVAAAIGVQEDDLRALNPHLVRGITPPGERFVVRIPTGRTALYAARFVSQRRVTGD